MVPHRVSPPRTTSIENFLDLNEIMSYPGPQSPSSPPMQSMDGYPLPPHVNSNFMEQLANENSERDSAMKPIQSSRIRQTDPQQMKYAMNGGCMDTTTTDFQLGPKARQNLNRAHIMEAPKPAPEQEPPMTYQQHPALPVNSAQMSNYTLEGYMPTPQFNCLDVAAHIQKCPLCSKFYDNDRSMYWAAIVLLSIACLYLLKRVMDCKK